MKSNVKQTENRVIDPIKARSPIECTLNSSVSLKMPSLQSPLNFSPNILNNDFEKKEGLVDW